MEDEKPSGQGDTLPDVEPSWTRGINAEPPRLPEYTLVINQSH
jgi:hypothetical protein